MTLLLRAQFTAGIAPWVADMFHTRPAIAGGHSYWSVSPATVVGKVTPGGIPVGFEDDTAYLQPTVARVLERAMAVPPTVARIRDAEAWSYVTLLCLLRRADLRFISVWNPTFLTLLLGRLASSGEALVRDLHDGTVTPPGGRATLRGVALPPPRQMIKRAQQVATALTAGSEAEQYACLWPQLTAISCWASAAAAGPAARLKRLFPAVTLLPKGLLATEGIVSFPLADCGGHTLALRSHVFEFVPVGGGVFAAAWEVEGGRDYDIALTTGGGLYRYALGDRVRVVGFADQCPLLEFLGRQGGTVDLYGEKLNEGHVAEVLRRSVVAADIVPDFLLLAPEGEIRPDHYTVFLAGRDPVGAVARATLARVVEEGLRENFQYDVCRRLRQLQAVEVCVIADPSGIAHEIYMHEMAARGLRLGEIKPRALDADTGWRARLNKEGSMFQV